MSMYFFNLWYRKFNPLLNLYQETMKLYQLDL